MAHQRTANLELRKAPDPRKVSQFIASGAEADPAAPPAIAAPRPARAAKKSAPKPRAPGPPDAQAAGGADAGPPRSSRMLVERKDGRMLRRSSFYMPPELAEEVGIYCVKRGADLTTVINRALRRLLDSGE